MNVITKTVSLPDGRTITIETGKLAKQADGSCTLKMGNTVLLATVCAAKDAVPGTDFMPLQVEYREQYAAAGRFPGGFTKREGKPNDDEILTCRLVDRALRPLFPSDYHAEVFVNVILFSADGVDQPDALAGFAASCALACSDIPFECPISEVRVARINGEYVINPTKEQMADADMDLMVGATAENIMMVEGEMKEVQEVDLLNALKAAHAAIKPMCALQDELMKELGTDKKREYCHEVNDDDLKEQVRKDCYDKAYAVVKQALDKDGRAEAFEAIITEFKEKYAEAHSDLTEEELEEKNTLADKYYHDVERDAMRRCILDEGIRLDGRKTTDIRPIWCEVSPLPMPHGSSIFTRGETQSLTTCTLGTKLDEKLIDNVLDRSYQKFLLHYNFPPFCTGEARPQRSVGRREIGHGHLAWRGLKGQIPEDFPYSVRIVSQILESNGSSSMATVCAGTLALMDAGVPLKRPVSGVAMGLMMDGDKPYVAGEKPTLSKLDTYILAELEDVKNRALACYEKFDFAGVTTVVTSFMSGDLSSFYLDQAKDALYCDAADSSRRKAIQYVVYQCAYELCLLLNPILSFTMDEVYHAIPGMKKESPQFEDMPKESHEYGEDVLAEFARFKKVRDVALKALEDARANGLIGQSSAGSLKLSLVKEDYDLLTSFSSEELASNLIVASVSLEKGKENKAEVVVAEGELCDRCRRIVPHTHEHGDDHICDRCATALKGE